jgi:hypothetical protein
MESMDNIIESLVTMVQSDSAYREAALRTRHEFDQRLNWDIFAKRLEELLESNLLMSGTSSIIK